MDELKQAYALLGLPEFAAKEEVEKRYTTLLRRARSRTKQAADTKENEHSFDEITKAYRLILAYEDRKVTEAFNEQEYGKYKKLAGPAQKIDHFWRYYRWHTFGAIAAVALIIYGIISFIDYRAEQERIANLPPVDLSISFMGNYFLHEDAPEKEPLENALLTALPDWNRFTTRLTYIPMNDQMQYAYLQKAVIELAAESPDVYIMDRDIFEWIGMQDILINLDEEVEGELKPLLKDGVALKIPTNNNPEEHVYGIDLSSTDIVDDLPILKQDMIIGIRADTERKDKALEFIKSYLATLK